MSNVSENLNKVHSHILIFFSCTGGTGKLATTFYKRIAPMISGENEITSYSQVLGWIQCILGFGLLRSSITCIRGSRSSNRRPTHDCVEQRSFEARSMDNSSLA